jgi:glycosyltransferase involved in cell wall biosynthesis
LEQVIVAMLKSANMRTLRIALDCRYLGPRPSGIGELVAALVRHLPALAPDIQFTFLRHPLRREQLSDAANVRQAVVDASANGPVTMLHLPLAVDLRGIDLFHAPANILPGGLTMPSITTIHDMMWLTHPRWCNPALWGRIEQRFYRHGIMRALNRSALITTVSEASRAEIVRFSPASADRVVVTRSGVADDFRPILPDAGALAQMGLVPGRRYVLVVGQGAPYKNHEGALRAFALACGSSPDIDLVLVQRRAGRRQELTGLASVLGIESRIRVLQPIDRSALVQLYSGAVALLHPSFIEGFGNPVAEAMACGCPVVTSDCSAMPEVAGGAALLADPYDPGSIAAALSRVLQDPALAAELRQLGLARAAELEWGAFAAANLALYRTVLDAPA